MLARWIKRHQDNRLARRVRELAARLAESETQLREAQATIRVMSLEQDKLIDVIERDRRRVEAETKCYAREIADAEPKDDKRWSSKTA